MPMNKEVDLNRMRRLVNMLASDREGERNNTATQIRNICLEAGQSIPDVMCKAYDSSAERVAKLERENEELADGIHDLKRQLDERLTADNSHRQGSGFEGFVDELWSMPQVRLLLLVGLLLARMWTWAAFEGGTDRASWITPAQNWALVGLFVFGFAKWAALEFERAGKASVIVKGLAFCLGSFMAIGAYFGAFEFSHWFRATERVGDSIELAWTPQSVGWGVVLLLLIYVATVSNLSVRLIDMAERSSLRMFTFLREWFA
jgi:hypothetical protein